MTTIIISKPNTTVFSYRCSKGRRAVREADRLINKTGMTVIQSIVEEHALNCCKQANFYWQAFYVEHITDHQGGGLHSLQLDILLAEQNHSMQSQNHSVQYYDVHSTNTTCTYMSNVSCTLMT